jgi:hypothetical protein
MNRLKKTQVFLFIMFFWGHCFLVFGQNSGACFKDLRFEDNVLFANYEASKSKQNSKKARLSYCVFQKTGEPINTIAQFCDTLSADGKNSLQILQIHDSDTLYLSFTTRNDSTFFFKTVAHKSSSKVEIWLGNALVSELHIDVFPLREEKVFIIPLMEVNIQEELLIRNINEIFEPYHLQFKFQIMPSFESMDLSDNALLDNPSVDYDHYTRQMRKIRDSYFKRFPNSQRDAYYVFLHEGFVNEKLKGYAVKNKNVSFVKNTPNDTLA